MQGLYIGKIKRAKIRFEGFEAEILDVMPKEAGIFVITKNKKEECDNGKD